MEKVVYVLGAGFSAPAGLPVMSNFIDKAKEIFFSDSEFEYKAEIQKTLESIREYAILKEYMYSDLSNIEELLSIADMKSYTSNRREGRNIRAFIKGVIQYYENSMFGKSTITDLVAPFRVIDNEVLTGYIAFVSSVQQLFVSSNEFMDFGRGQNVQSFVARPQKEVDYGLITFNYDSILERSCSMIDDRAGRNGISFSRGKSGVGPRLCKLHGSVDNDTIVPPTWAKDLKGEIKQDWADAHDLLRTANKIRIVGFSFPNTDSHISYLFKSAIIENENLKEIDVLCLDNSNGVIHDKYNSIFSTRKYRFLNFDVERYFKRIQTSNDKFGFHYNRLEETHEGLFS